MTRVPSPTARPSSRSTSARRSARPVLPRKTIVVPLARARSSARRRTSPAYCGAGRQASGIASSAVVTSLTATPGVAARRAASAPGVTSTSSTSGVRPSARRFWSSTALAQKPSASRATSSGSTTTTEAPSRWAHGGTVAPGTSGTSSTRPSGTRPRSSDSRSVAVSRRVGKRSCSSRRSAATTERVANTSPSGIVVSASRGPVARCVSGSNVRRLSIVSPKNSSRTGASRPTGNTSRMPPRRAICPGAVTGSSRT